MPAINRRSFLKASAAGAAGAAVAGCQKSSTLVSAEPPTVAGTKSGPRVLGANERVRVAVLGVGRQGKAHISRWLELPKEAELVCLADPDPNQFPSAAAVIQKANGKVPPMVLDFRQVLDDKGVDAISVVTPNHWHALITILACQAGKDVYVEKPCSHNFQEGRVAVEAARKHKRIVQHGTQTRGMSDAAQSVELIKSGKYGKLLVARGLCYKDRPSIGTKAPSAPPQGMDYNLWLGPAPESVKHHANLVHYNWHWFWDIGNGEIGNQGVHQMDVARWGIPNGVWPKSVMSIGGRYGVDDQGETPNTQIAVLDYGPTQLIFEVRGLDSPKHQGEKVGNIFELEQGVIGGKMDFKFTPKGKDKPEKLADVAGDAYKRGGDGSIFRNFVACIKSRNADSLYADIQEGHISSTLCHLANISYRLGEDQGFNAKPFGDNAAANETLDRMKQHLEKNGVDLTKVKLRVGKKLTVDEKQPSLVSDADAAKLMTRTYRKGFELPEKV